jgi:radical SAM superfamily enzyme YgiQ (UPF0313 family)
MRLLLVTPKWPDESLWGQIHFRFPYLSLTTLAALTDKDWDISIVDENTQDLDYSDLPDLVAISLMTPLAKRGYRIAQAFRTRGVPVVLGGIHPTMMKDEAKAHADVVVVGEAEQVWPKVLSDFKRGDLKPFYEAIRFCDLDGMAIPRRDLLKKNAYFFVNTTQTTRGCPFDCDFCSVTSFYGRTYRVRPVDNVISEIDDWRGGFVFFVDDNIAGIPSFAKKLFTELVPLRIKWFSQASIRIVKDRELLSLAQRSGCKGLFIGFESLSQQTLQAMGKSMNLADEYKEAVKIIHDHGIGIQGSFIFGTDNDDMSVFSDVLRFIEKTHMEAALFSVLTPFPGTKIQKVLHGEGRIIHCDWDKYDMNHVVFRPKKMTPEQLQDGFNWAYRRLYGYKSILTRLFPFRRSGFFYAVQNCGFRQGWRKALDAMT